MRASDSKPPALRLIIAYKQARAVLSLAGAAALGVAIAGGATERLHAFAARLNDHATSALALELSSLLAVVKEPKLLRASPAFVANERWL